MKYEKKTMQYGKKMKLEMKKILLLITIIRIPCKINAGALNKKTGFLSKSAH